MKIISDNGCAGAPVWVNIGRNPNWDRTVEQEASAWAKASRHGACVSLTPEKVLSPHGFHMNCLKFPMPRALLVHMPELCVICGLQLRGLYLHTVSNTLIKHGVVLFISKAPGSTRISPHFDILFSASTRL